MRGARVLFPAVLLPGNLILLSRTPKRLNDSFVSDRRHLAAVEHRPDDIVDTVHLDYKGVLESALDGLSCIHLEKSAGSDGHNAWCSTKAEFLMQQRECILDAARRRVMRRKLVGDNISLFTGCELVTLGLRAPVHQASKLEYHKPRQCFVIVDGVVQRDAEGFRVAVAHPTMRSILILATVDHLVQHVLQKPSSHYELAI